jgi:hypothetical protein
MAPHDLRVSEEELALAEDQLMDAARKRLAGENAVRVEKVVEGLDPGDFVIVAAPDDVEEPFYLAQVVCVCYIRVSLWQWFTLFYFPVLNTVRLLQMTSTMTKLPCIGTSQRHGPEKETLLNTTNIPLKKRMNNYVLVTDKVVVCESACSQEYKS